MAPHLERRGDGAGMRISKIQLASGIAVAAMFGVAASNASAEDLTINSATTTPVSTSDPVSGGAVASGNVTVASGGSIAVTAGQTAITVDSSNNASNGGQISSTNADNTTGISLLPGFSGAITNSGSISLLEDYTQTDADTDGDLDGAIATGTNRHGIFLQSGGTFTGNITNSGVINVEGNNSSGITLDSVLDGDLVTSGAVSVLGDNSVAIAINEGVTGDVRIAGTVSARGENTSGLVVNGEIGGDLIINGSWTVSGYHSLTRPSDTSDLDADDTSIGGPAVAVHYSVAGGIVIAGTGVEDDEDDDDDGLLESGTTPDTDDDASATIVSYGSAPALLIEADPSANLVLGPSLDGYGLHVQGSVIGTAVYDGIDGIAIQIQGSGATTVEIADGIAIDGPVQGNAADGNATGILIGSGANVSELLVRRTLSSFIVTDNAHTARALAIEGTATLPSVNNSGTIRSQVFGEGGDAIGIIDTSNSLATITNSGGIVAEVFATDSTPEDGLPPPPVTGSAIAIDVSASTIDVTLNQIADTPFTDEDAVDNDVNNRPPTIIRGEIRFGSGADTINLLDGDIIGDVSFGLGNDLFTVNGGNFAGRINDADGVLHIEVTDGTFVHLGGTTNLTSAYFDADAILGVVLSDTPGETSFIHSSGAIHFEPGSEILPIVPTGLPVSGTHTFLTADGGLTGAGNVTGAVTNTDTPYLYTLSIDTVLGDPNSLQASFLMKTTTQLGMNTNQSIAFDPIIDALRQDDAAAAAFAALSTQADFFSAYDDLMPSYAAASTELAATAIQQMQSATTNRMAYTRLQGLDEVSAWVQEIAYGVNREPISVNGQEFRGNGFGLAMGIDGPLDNGALFGLSAAFLASEAEEPHRPEGEISSWFGQGNAYLGTAIGPIDLDFVVGGGFGQMRERRFVEIGTTFDAQTEAEWWAYEGHGSARASMPLQVGEWLVLTPQASLTYVALGEEGYTEEGGGAAIDLEADDAFTQRLWGDVGMEISARWRLRSGGIVAPRLYAGYRANMIDDGGERTFRFVSGGSDFTLTDEGSGDGGPLVGIGFDATNGWSTFAIGYEGEFGDQLERHSLNASVRFRF